MARPLTVGMLGAGRIASGFDAPGSPRILTLAHAVRATPGLSLGGFFDANVRRAEAAERRWGCRPGPRERTAWLDAGWDIVVVATPDAAHPDDVRDVIARKPRAILAEKPLALDGRDALRLIGAARRAGVPLLVDFPRREHSAIRRLTRLFQTGRLGAVRRVVGLCSGGMRHNGVHLLDIVAAWVPGVRRVSLVSRRQGVAHLEMTSARGIVPLLLFDAAQPGCYAWDLRVETERGRVDLGGVPETLRVSTAGTHPIYPGFAALVDGIAVAMEDEPLLGRTVARTAALARSATAARAQWEIERARQQFFNHVFAHLPDAPEHAS